MIKERNTRRGSSQYNLPKMPTKQNIFAKNANKAKHICRKCRQSKNRILQFLLSYIERRFEDSRLIEFRGKIMSNKCHVINFYYACAENYIYKQQPTRIQSV